MGGVGVYLVVDGRWSCCRVSAHSVPTLSFLLVVLVMF